MSALRPGALGSVVVLGLLGGTASAVVNIETVPVGDPANTADTRYNGIAVGSVGYAYNIGKYEVTAGQYTEFLNKVAATDTYGLYNTNMANTSFGSGIVRSGSSGSYTYSVASDFVDRPVNYVSYWNACRFANWLNNGQPSGAQDAHTTESGTYTLNGYNATDGRTIQRNPGAKWAVTSEDEWYKAAYYKSGSANAGYWNYPAGSDIVPLRDLADVSGNNANCGGDNSNPIDSGKSTTLVGEFQNSDSPYGTFDQGGNLWEWNEVLRFQDATDAYRGMRGGAFDSAAGYMHRSSRNMDLPTTAWASYGFRVVQVPEPGSALLALASFSPLTSR